VVRIADAHCDFLSFCVIKDDNARLYDHVDLSRLIIGGVALQVFAVWTPPDSANRMRLSFSQIDFLDNFAAGSEGIVRLCTEKRRLRDNRNISAILAIEGGSCIECGINAIRSVYERGARIMSLTWNEENDFAFGCGHKSGGVKQKGLEAIELLNSLNIALDLSHINERGFYDALEAYKRAPCATHSCAYSLCKSPRNLKDEQITAIINKNGFIGINFYNAFLGGDIVTVNSILEHIEHVLCLGGKDAVGFGSDFCGVTETPKGLKSAADFQIIPETMARRGYTDELINKICYGNFASYILQFL